MIQRRKTRQIKVGSVRIGGNAPISIQSMTKVPTSNVAATIAQIKRLEDAGCEIVRVAVKEPGDAAALRMIKKSIRIPLVADIHFDWRLAIKAIENGADKIRMNPGNIKERKGIEAVLKAAAKKHIPIRIGVNSGSARSSDLVRPAMEYIKIFEELKFRDIIISLKASDVVSTVESYKRIAKLCDYPLHLGVTAAGTYEQGIVKSSAGIGALLLDGIGDTIRVSLAADPIEEVIAAKRILGSLKIRHFGPDIIACPTCGRCQVDLVKVVRDIEYAVRSTQYAVRKHPLRIAVMGCEVNGPGEAMAADIGIAFGKNSGMIFKKGKILKKVSVKKAISELLKLIADS